MYRLCVWMLVFIRKYCERNGRRTNTSWYNLWADMIGDAKCYKPVLPPPLPQPITQVSTLIEHSTRLVSLAQLLYAALTAEPANAYDLEDISANLAMRIEIFDDTLDPLVETPDRRPITPLAKLYDKYKLGESCMFRYHTTMLQSDGNAYMYLKGLLTSRGDAMTLTVKDDDTFLVTLTLATRPSDSDIEVNGLTPC